MCLETVRWLKESGIVSFQRAHKLTFFLCLLRIGYFLIFEVRSRRAEMLIEAVFLVSLFGGFGIEGIIFNSITLMLTAITCFMTFV